MITAVNQKQNSYLICCLGKSNFHISVSKYNNTGSRHQQKDFFSLSERNKTKSKLELLPVQKTRRDVKRFSYSGMSSIYWN